MSSSFLCHPIPAATGGETINDNDRVYNALYETCKDPELNARLNNVTNALTEAINLASTHRGAVEGFRLNAKRERSNADQAKMIINNDARVQDHLNRAKEFDRKSANAAAELAKVEKTIIELNRQQDSIREQMLVP